MALTKTSYLLPPTYRQVKRAGPAAALWAARATSYLSKALTVPNCYR